MMSGQPNNLFAAMQATLVSALEEIKQRLQDELDRIRNPQHKSGFNISLWRIKKYFTNPVKTEAKIAKITKALAWLRRPDLQNIYEEQGKVNGFHVLAGLVPGQIELIKQNFNTDPKLGGLFGKINATPNNQSFTANEKEYLLAELQSFLKNSQAKIFKHHGLSDFMRELLASRIIKKLQSERQRSFNRFELNFLISRFGLIIPVEQRVYDKINPNQGNKTPWKNLKFEQDEINYLLAQTNDDQVRLSIKQNSRYRYTSHNDGFPGGGPVGKFLLNYTFGDEPAGRSISEILNTHRRTHEAIHQTAATKAVTAALQQAKAEFPVRVAIAKFQLENHHTEKYVIYFQEEADRAVFKKHYEINPDEAAREIGYSAKIALARHEHYFQGEFQHALVLTSHQFNQLKYRQDQTFENAFTKHDADGDIRPYFGDSKYYYTLDRNEVFQHELSNDLQEKIKAARAPVENSVQHNDPMARPWQRV